LFNVKSVHKSTCFCTGFTLHSCRIHEIGCFREYFVKKRQYSRRIHENNLFRENLMNKEFNGSEVIFHYIVKCSNKYLLMLWAKLVALFGQLGTVQNLVLNNKQ